MRKTRVTFVGVLFRFVALLFVFVALASLYCAATFSLQLFNKAVVVVLALHLLFIWSLYLRNPVIR